MAARATRATRAAALPARLRRAFRMASVVAGLVAGAAASPAGADEGREPPPLGAALPGVTLPLPAVPALVLPTDRDRDGVLDRDDACPGSGRGVRVAADGCLALDSGDSELVFAPGSARLAPAATRRLERVLVPLERFPAKRLEVTATARLPDDDDRSFGLALRRAEAVVGWFARRGVPTARIDIVAVARLGTPAGGSGAAGGERVTLRLLR